MIQRIQSVWLLLASVATLLGFRFAFFSGNTIAADKSKVFKDFTATSNLPILVLTAALGLIALMAIFLYKNRKLQLQTIWAAIVLSILIIGLYYMEAQKFIESRYNLTAVVTLAVPVFAMLAARGVSKDQKLVKSLDRLR
jgi:dipeptide/tripeptide permease